VGWYRDYLACLETLDIDRSILGKLRIHKSLHFK
jgi:hypothetical protein